MEGNRRVPEMKQRLEKAHAQADEAAARFNELIQGVPSGIPYPDGVVRIEMAAAAYRRALEELEDASADLVNFMTDSD
jgi:hypothetical protein